MQDLQIPKIFPRSFKVNFQNLS